MSQDHYSIGTITNQQGNTVVGKHNIVSNNGVQPTEVRDATQQLMEEIKKLGLSPEQEREIEETVEAISEQATSEKPNKTILSSLLDGLTKTIDTVGKTPALITAYESWKKFVSSFI